MADDGLTLAPADLNECSESSTPPSASTAATGQLVTIAASTAANVEVGGGGLWQDAPAVVTEHSLSFLGPASVLRACLTCKEWQMRCVCVRARACACVCMVEEVGGSSEAKERTRP